MHRESEMAGSLCIQQPADTAKQLILLFHGVGASARDMARQRLPEVNACVATALTMREFTTTWDLRRSRNSLIGLDAQRPFVRDAP